MAAVLLFWMVMAALLIRLEFFSTDSELMPVPVGFVMKLMFHHEQSADLVLYAQRHRQDGSLHLQPRHLPRGSDGLSAPMDLVSGSGSFALNVPGLNAHRIVLRGVVELDSQEAFQRLELTASLHEPRQTGPGLTVFLEGSPALDHWHYQIRQSGVVVREETGPMSALLAALDPHLPGLNLQGIESMQRQQSAALRITAHRGTLQFNGEEIDTYVISVRHGEAMESTIHFNQLGQILAVKTFPGYDLYDEGLAP